MKKSEEKEIRGIEDRTRWILWITISTLLVLLLVFYLEFYDVKKNSLTGNPIGGSPPAGGGTPAGGEIGGSGGDSGSGSNNLQGEGTAGPVEGTPSGGGGGGSTFRECADEKDNDNDGYIDLADVFGCENAEDNSEYNSPTGFECQDGKDNDGDGKMDGNDPECKSQKDDYEMFECSDGKDNEPFEFEPGPHGDGLIDAEDPGCDDTNGAYNPLYDNEAAATSECQDKKDNDEDGIIDLDDPDCIFKEDYTESGSIGSGDQDSDGWIDSDDNCPTTYNPNQENKDGDKFGDACDNCPEISNDGQLDKNNNGIGDACDGSLDEGTGEENGNREGEEEQREGPNSYLIKGGELFNPGEFTRLAVIAGDEIAFNIDQVVYTIIIDEVTLEYLTFTFVQPSGEAETATLKIGDIGKISINDKVVAVKLDDLTEPQIAFITIAALGIAEEGAEQTPETAEEELNTLFNSVVEDQNQVSAEKASQQELERTEEQKRVAAAIIVIAIIIITIIWLIVLRRQMKKRNS